MHNIHLIRTYADNQLEALLLVQKFFEEDPSLAKRYTVDIEGVISPFGDLWFLDSKSNSWSPGLREKGKALHYLKEVLWGELQWTQEETNKLNEYMEYFLYNHEEKPLKPMLDSRGFSELEDLVSKMRAIAETSKRHLGVFSEESWAKIHEKVSRQFEVWKHTFRPYCFNKVGLTEICEDEEDRYREDITPFLVVLSVESA